MKALFWVFLALLLATCYHRVIHMDDAWFAEQAYWLVRDGRVRSAFFEGLNGWGNQLFVFHKGFIYFGALLQGLFGFSLPVSKCVGAIWTAAGGVLLFFYGRYQRFTNAYLWLLVLLYTASGTIIEYAFVNRPEPIFVTLGFGSFWLLTTKRRAWAGVLAGLAVFTHLNGLCFVLAGVGWLLGRHQWREAIGFGLVSGLVSSLYLLDVVQTGAWSTFWIQLHDDPALAHIGGLSGRVRLFFSVYRQFMVNKTTAVLAFFVLGTLALHRRALHDDTQHPARSVGYYLLWLVVGHALITRTYTLNYVFTFVPFCAVFVVQCVAYARTLDQSTRQSTAFYVLLTLYLLTGLAKIVYTIRENSRWPDPARQNAHLARLIGQPGSSVLAPLNFFYEQIQQYHIHAIDWHLPGFHDQSHFALNDRQLFAFAERARFAAVITYDGKGPDAPLTDTRPLTDSLNHIGHYHRIYQDRWNSLYLPDR